MGQALARAKKETSADKGTCGKLLFSPVNESLLNTIVSFIEQYPGKHGDEAKLRFKNALVWPTELRPADFAGNSAYEERGDDVISLESTVSDGAPVLRLHLDNGVYTMSVYTICELDVVLKVAGGKKMNETRAALEANMDPVAKMTGDRFSATDGEDMAAYRYMEEILRAKEGAAAAAEPEGATEDNSEDKKKTLRLVMHLQKLDTDLLKLYIEGINDVIRLDAQAVEKEVYLLRGFCGEDDEKTANALEDIQFTSDHAFANGCRSPPWRQVYGDIAYIEVRPHDVDKFWVVASTNGYYEMKGYNKESNDYDYERNGDICNSIVTLIKGKSARFTEIISKQDFGQLEESRGKVETMKEVSGEGGQSEKGGGQKDDKQKGKNGKRLEPSLTWRAAEVDEGKKSRVKGSAKEKTPSPRKGLAGPVAARKSRMESRKMRASLDAEEAFSESSSESEEEEETQERRQEAGADLPSDYWQIQKLVKYLKGGNQTATIIALCAMRDFSLSLESSQLAIRDVGGLEVLINLLDTEEIKCKIGSLKILTEISKNPQIRRAIADLGGLQTMVQILRDPNKELRSLAAETIANVAKFRRARRTVRQHGGISKLVGLLDCAPLNQKMTAELEKDVDVARCGALALWSCSKSTKNKQAMRKAGVIPLLARLLKSPHENMLIPVVGTLQECASEPSYRLAIRTEGMVQDLVSNLRLTENQELQMHCASALFKCAEEKATRDLVRSYDGLEPLVKLLQNTDKKELLGAVTGAIWKCAISPENVQRFQSLKAIDLLVGLLNEQPEEVLINVVGALGECAKDPPNRAQIRKAGGISPMVHLLTGTNQALLINVTRAVGQCAEESDNMVIIDRLDGVRLLWSLLKNQNTEVQASAAWAICPCIENAKDAGEMVRSFVGGLELIVSLLRSTDLEVLASVCAAIANIAKDEENLAVITDHGVVPLLARLTEKNEDRLRSHLAEAIARCCSWGNNRVLFGKEGAVAPLVQYLRSKDKAVHRSTARALFQLSKDPDNCITMHAVGVVRPLMEMVGADDSVLQEASAGCISNIRRLALANEKAKYS